MIISRVNVTTTRQQQCIFFIRKLFQSIRLYIKGILRLASKCAWQLMIALLPDGGLGRHLYLEGLKFGNDLLFQGIVNTSKELLVDLTCV